MMKKLIVLPALLLALVAVTATAAPHGERGERGEGRWAGRFERLADTLELTDAQKAQWEEIVTAHRESQEGEREEVKALHQELQTLVESANPNATEVGELFLAIHAKKEAAQESREALRTELRGILTAEQAEKLDMLKEMKGERHHRGRHGRRGGGPGWGSR